MLAKVQGCTVIGLAAKLVEVEVEVTNGPAAFTLDGVTDAALNKTSERVWFAIHNSGYCFPDKCITIMITPAQVKPDCLSFCLPIAIGVLLATGQITSGDQAKKALFLGELGVDGKVHHTKGILPMVTLASMQQITTVFIPATDTKEASLVRDVSIFPVETLRQLIAHLNGEQRMEASLPHQWIRETRDHVSTSLDMALIRGQEPVKR